MDGAHDQPEAVDPAIVLEGQLRQCYGRVVYTHKTHEKCADSLLRWHGGFKWALIVLSAITTAGLISAVFGDTKTGAVIGVIASTALLGLNLYTKEFDFAAQAQKHRRAAADLWLIRERYLSLLSDLIMGQCTVAQARSQRDDLLDDLHSIYTGSPSTNFKAYKKAQRALQELEDMTFSDAEIDAFLPKELKRAGKHGSSVSDSEPRKEAG